MPLQVPAPAVALTLKSSCMKVSLVTGGFSNAYRRVPAVPRGIVAVGKKGEAQAEAPTLCHSSGTAAASPVLPVGAGFRCGWLERAQLTSHGGEFCIHEVEHRVHGRTQLEGKKKAVRTPCMAAPMGAQLCATRPAQSHWDPPLVSTQTRTCLCFLCPLFN